jgi:hypothetical protein
LLTNPLHILKLKAMITHQEEMARHHAQELKKSIEQLAVRDSSKAAKILAETVNSLVQLSIEIKGYEISN